MNIHRTLNNRNCHETIYLGEFNDFEKKVNIIKRKTRGYVISFHCFLFDKQNIIIKCVKEITSKGWTVIYTFLTHFP